MKLDVHARLRALHIASVAGSIALLLAVAATPLLVSRGVSLTQSVVIEEDMVEALAIVLLMGISAASWRIYRRHLQRLTLEIQDSTRLCRRLETRLADAFGYIGTVNVELGEIESILCKVERYPQSRSEFQRLLNDFAQRAMVIAGTKWAAVRIIDGRSFKTIKEAVQHRAGTHRPSNKISNRCLVEGRAIEGVSAVQTGAGNLPIRTAVVLPVQGIPAQDRILISAIAGEIERLFIIFESGFVFRFQPGERVRTS